MHNCMFLFIIYYMQCLLADNKFDVEKSAIPNMQGLFSVYFL